MNLKLTINWNGPYSLDEVIDTMTDGGKAPDYDGEDYGVYQIYGHHILNGDDTLLYIGKATNQKFSTRFKQHRKWLLLEEKKDKIKIYLGRAYNPKRHNTKDKWTTWKDDLELAEKIMIYKYSPNYNSSCISRLPKMGAFKSIELIHTRNKARLLKSDKAPDDFV